MQDLVSARHEGTLMKPIEWKTEPGWVNLSMGFFLTAPGTKAKTWIS